MRAMDGRAGNVVMAQEQVMLPPPDACIPQAPEIITQPLAEKLPAAVAMNALNKFSRRRRASGKFHSAWATTEAAVCQDIPLSDDLRSLYIDYARELLYEPMHLQGDQTSVLLRLESAVLCSFLPIFERRALNRVVTKEDVSNVYASMGSALAYAYTNDRLALEVSTTPPSQCAELIVMGFAARIGSPDFLLYPSSPREEQSEQQPQNHDNYFITSGEKIPIQIKVMECDKEYDERIRVITIESIMEVVNRSQRRFAKKQPSRCELIHDYMQLGHLVIKESAGEPLDPAERNALDKASQLVARLALS